LRKRDFLCDLHHSSYSCGGSCGFFTTFPFNIKTLIKEIISEKASKFKRLFYLIHLIVFRNIVVRKKLAMELEFITALICNKYFFDTFLDLERDNLNQI